MKYSAQIPIDWKEETLEQVKCSQCGNDSFNIVIGMLTPVLPVVGINHHMRKEMITWTECSKCKHRRETTVHRPTFDVNAKAIFEMEEGQ